MWSWAIPPVSTSAVIQSYATQITKPLSSKQLLNTQKSLQNSFGTSFLYNTFCFIFSFLFLQTFHFPLRTTTVQHPTIGKYPFPNILFNSVLLFSLTGLHPEMILARCTSPLSSCQDSFHAATCLFPPRKFFIYPILLTCPSSRGGAEEGGAACRALCQARMSVHVWVLIYGAELHWLSLGSPLPAGFCPKPVLPLESCPTLMHRNPRLGSDHRGQQLPVCFWTDLSPIK